MENWQRAGFALYVHWPFCAAKCPYCDFNSHVTARVDQARWRDALLRDLAHWAARTPGRVLSSVFFGGGTPSLMPPETVEAIVSAARAHWTPANDLEVTLEANPTSVEAGRFAAYRDAGVNRFSVGLQALNDTDLRRLGRLHSVAEGRRAFDIARDLTDRVSFDLIYARQDQGPEAWRRELREALSLAGEHLSLYQLTIETGTAFGARHAAGGLRGLPGEDLAVDLWQITQDLTAAAGLRRYETSNHARAGAEARHNLVYWRGGDWVGIGPGAHGRIGFGSKRIATEAARMPQDWLARSEDAGVGTSTEEVQQHIDIANEYMMMGLRMQEGVDIDLFHGLGGELDPAAVADLSESGHLTRTGDRLVATESGALLLDAILPRILSV
ncbi:radical SAM family heme chaperone HemW [Jannaschia sp. S6380]|uniref:radical SAM family heme chaperone HemW n=1 Tax=Jannaschia sp. S6380 TaxID=2926408 RepID=UPI001FF30130|nr:radical SAM family heme chaperone HemW [Jannaschia sp. S6380]MCK0168450.1 radical SAM family heme chaperone HemW [Jannaschia sp. S6380]